MPKFEYAELTGEYDGPFQKPLSHRRLSEYGALGWEAVSAVWMPNNSGGMSLRSVLLKREIPSDNKA